MMEKTHTGAQSLLVPGADRRLSSPSAARNIAPILAVLRQHMPARGAALELASGTGEHSVQFAAAFPEVEWTPTDIDADRLASIRAWIAASGLANIQPPLVLNAGWEEWPVAPASLDVLMVVNLLHLVSEAVVQRLFTGAARVLRPGGRWFLYGPFLRSGVYASEGDRRFHQQLVGQDPAIGYKDVDTMADLAAANGLTIGHRHDMPANNLMLVLQAATG